MKYARLLLLTLFVATFAFAQAPATQPAPDPADPVQQARKMIQEGKHNDAIALLNSAIKANPKNYDAHLSLGVANDLKGNYAEAQKHFQHAIDLATPEQKPQAMRQMAFSYAFARKPAEAAKFSQPIFDQRMAANDFTGAAEIANELARIYLESGDINNAETWYRRGYESAIKKTDLTPQQKALWQFRWEHAQARIAARRNDKEAARKHVAAAKTALDQTGDKDQQVFYPYLTGYVAYYLGEPKTALADLQQANQRDPFILALMAQAHEKLGEKQQATELYKKIITLNGHNPTNAFARPLAKEKLGLAN